jgi:hypothetical protein
MISQPMMTQMQMNPFWPWIPNLHPPGLPAPLPPPPAWVQPQSSWWTADDEEEDYEEHHREEAAGKATAAEDHREEAAGKATAAEGDKAGVASNSTAAVASKSEGAGQTDVASSGNAMHVRWGAPLHVVESSTEDEKPPRKNVVRLRPRVTVVTRETKKRKADTKTIKIFSVGDRYLELEKHAAIEEVAKAVRKAFTIDEDITFVARCFGLSRGSSAAPVHCGEHLRNLKNVAFQENFQEQGRILWDDVSQYFEQGNSKCTIVFYCSQGRHRSVSAARLHAEAFRRSGFVVDGPMHLMQSTRHWSHLCTNCRFCEAGNWQKPAMFDEFARQLKEC